MNKLFSYVSLFCIVVGLIFQRSARMSEAILKLPINVLEVSLRLVVSGCLWNGFLMLGQKSGLVTWMSRLLNTFFRYVYPDIKDEENLIGLIASNFIANLIGLGSLAMISGMKAMKALDDLNDHQQISRSMKTLIIFNTTGCSILPMSIISMRDYYGSIKPMSFIFDTFLIGMIVLMCGILIQKGVEHFGK